MEKTKIQEMAMERPDAISLCRGLGRSFIKHFQKVMDAGGPNDPDFIHHIDVEMFSWYRDAYTIKMKQDKKPIEDEDLIDWFFHVCQVPEDFIEIKYLDLYTTFIAMALVNKTQKLSETFKQAVEKEEREGRKRWWW